MPVGANFMTPIAEPPWEVLYFQREGCVMSNVIGAGSALELTVENHVDRPVSSQSTLHLRRGGISHRDLGGHLDRHDGCRHLPLHRHSHCERAVELFRAVAG